MLAPVGNRRLRPGVAAATSSRAVIVVRPRSLGLTPLARRRNDRALPGVSVPASVLTNGAPLALAEVRAPAPPRSRLGKALSLFRHGRPPMTRTPRSCAD